MRRYLAILAFTLACLGVSVAANAAIPTPYPGASTPAAPLVTCPHDNTCAVAGINGTGTAMNDWFLNGSLYQYTSGKSNENFGYVTMNRCLGGDQVTAACPFANSSFDNALLGKFIVQIVSVTGGGTCVGAQSSRFFAYENLTCNGPNGTGGGLYTAFVVAGNHSLVSVGCTNDNNAWCQLAAAVSGAQDSFQQQGSGATQWSPLPLCQYQE